MKMVGWLIGIVVLLVAGVVAYVALNSGNLVKDAIERLGPEYLGTDVHLDRVDLRLLEGEGEFFGLQIDNPDGYAGPFALRLGLITIALDIAQVSDQLVVIKEMQIDKAELGVVVKGTKTNLQRILDNLEDATVAVDDSPEDDLKIIIDRFAFTNARTSVSSDVLGELELAIADVYLTDIGRKTDGATVAETLRQVLRPVYESVSREMVRQGFDVEGVETNLKGRVVEKLSEKFGGLKKLTEQLGREQ